MTPAEFAPPAVDHLPLIGRHVTLEPLAAGHAEELWAAAADAAAEIFRFYPAPVASLAAMQAWVDEALELQGQGQVRAFVQRRRSDGQAVGSTRYGAISMPHRRGEIGWTWLAPTAQRSGINTETKLLMLQLGFDQLKFERVELKTDHRNLRSQAAIERIGGKREGALRHHILCADGSWRDTVYYSILRAEWPEVRARLQERLEAAESR